MKVKQYHWDYELSMGYQSIQIMIDECYNIDSNIRLENLYYGFQQS